MIELHGARLGSTWYSDLCTPVTNPAIFALFPAASVHRELCPAGVVKLSLCSVLCQATHYGCLPKPTCNLSTYGNQTPFRAHLLLLRKTSSLPFLRSSLKPLLPKPLPLTRKGSARSFASFHAPSTVFQICICRQAGPSVLSDSIAIFLSASRFIMLRLSLIAVALSTLSFAAAQSQNFTINVDSIPDATKGRRWLLFSSSTSLTLCDL